MATPPAAATPVNDGERVLFTSVFVRLLLTQMLFSLAWSMFLVMPKFLVQRFAADAEQVGWVTAIPGVAVVASIPFIGRFIDRYPPRRFMVTGSVLACLAAFGIATLPALDGRVFLYQALQGLGFVFCFNAGGAMAADLAPPAQLGRAMSWFGAANLGMNAVAPTIGEELAMRYEWPAAYFFAAGAACLAALVASQLPAHQREDDPADEQERSAPTWSFVRGPLLRVVAAAGTSACAFMALFAFHQPFALENGVTVVRDYFLGFTATALGVRFLMGGLSDRFGTHRIAFVTQLGYISPPIALALVGPTHLMAVGALHGLFHGMHFPVMSALAVERVSASTRGRALTLVVGAFNGGAAFAGWGLGKIAKAYGYEAAFYAGSVVTFIGLVALGRPEKDPSTAPDTRVL